ncbi:hypothetical protein Q8G38_10445 [Halomonas venusta]|uniref:hypothetical protein n=1 Tax=Vreelandella venusta TaxID=44935 RepID=UPI00295E5816|nr:hypothetical protein [Halomonas venusta]MDW0359735.1 hypothetical protein [Halomonas venusta]
MNYSELHKFVKNEGVDGFFVFYTALLNGMDVQRMPGQLFLINNYKTPEAKTSFVHSVAQSTRLSTTTFVLQKRFRRVLFQQAKVPMPKAATFSFFSRKDPVKYANKIGYPLVVKEMFGENPSFSVYNVKNKKELFSGIEKVRHHLPVSSERAPSSYAQTINLGSAESIDDNTRVKSNKSRFIIEKQLVGDAYRVYVVGGKVSLVLKPLPSGNGFIKVLSPSQDVINVAESSVNAVPGIANAAIDIVESNDGLVYLVEFCERLLPPSEIFSEASFSIVSDIYQRLFESEVSLVGGVTSSIKKRAAYLIKVSGLSDVKSFVKTLKKISDELKVAFRVSDTCNIFGQVSLQLAGGCVEVAAALEKLFEDQNVTHLKIVRKKLLKIKQVV